MGTSSQDSKDSSHHKILTPMPTAGRATTTTGSTKVQTRTPSGTSPRESGDGSGGKTDAMSCSLTNLKLDGTMFQTVDSTLNKTLDTESSTQSMSTTTISTARPTSNPDKPEVL